MYTLMPVLPLEAEELVHTILLGLNQYEYDDLDIFWCHETNAGWDKAAKSLQSTPEWCLEARCTYTLTLGDPYYTWRCLSDRLTGKIKTIFDAAFLSTCSDNDFLLALGILDQRAKRKAL